MFIIKAQRGNEDTSSVQPIATINLYHPVSTIEILYIEFVVVGYKLYDRGNSMH